MRQIYGEPMTKTEIQPVSNWANAAPVPGLRLETAAGGLWLIAQTDRPNPRRDVETGVAFDADRLQRDRTIGAADQYIGAGPDADGGAPRGTDIITVQRTGPEVGGRREHRPNQHAALRIADIDTEFVDSAGIKLGTPRCRSKGATQRFRRAEDKTPAAGDVAGQRADTHAALRLRSS